MNYDNNGGSIPFRGANNLNKYNMNNYKTYSERIKEQQIKEKQDNLKANIIGFLLAVLFIGGMIFCMSLK